MTDEHRMEHLSRAYVHAIAAMAGCTCAKPDPDYGFDLTLRRVRRRAGDLMPDGRSLDLQLKSTTTAEVTDEHVIYDLPVRAYNLLRRATLYAPALLVLLPLPADQDKWLEQSEECLQIRGCAYWLSLRGAPAVANASTVRIRIPRANQFTPAALLRIMTTG